MSSLSKRKMWEILNKNKILFYFRYGFIREVRLKYKVCNLNSIRICYSGNTGWYAQQFIFLSQKRKSKLEPRVSLFFYYGWKLNIVWHRSGP